MGCFEESFLITNVQKTGCDAISHRSLIFMLTRTENRIPKQQQTSPKHMPITFSFFCIGEWTVPQYRYTPFSFSGCSIRTKPGSGINKCVRWDDSVVSLGVYRSRSKRLK